MSSGFSSGFDFEEDDAPQIPAMRAQENSITSGSTATNGNHLPSTIDLTQTPSPPLQKKHRPLVPSPSRSSPQLPPPTTSQSTNGLALPSPKPTLSLPTLGKRSQDPSASGADRNGVQRDDQGEQAMETERRVLSTSPKQVQDGGVGVGVVSPAAPPVKSTPTPFATGSRPNSNGSLAIPSLPSNTPIPNPHTAFAAYAAKPTPPHSLSTSSSSSTQHHSPTPEALLHAAKVEAARQHQIKQQQAQALYWRQQQAAAQAQGSHPHPHPHQARPSSSSTSSPNPSLGRIPMINTGAASRTPASYFTQSPVSATPANGRSNSKDYYRMQSEMVQAGISGQMRSASGQSGFTPRSGSASSSLNPGTNSKGKGKEVIDLTNEDDNPKSDDEVIVDDTPLCIGQLTSLALILYPVAELQPPPPPPLPILYDAAGRPVPIDPRQIPVPPPQPPLPVHVYRAGKHNGNETLRLSTPITQDVFGVVEHRVANVIAPLLGDGYSGTGVTKDGNGKLWCEAAVARKGEKNPMMLPLTLLLFCRPYDVPFISRTLELSTIYLEHPLQYIPQLHGGFRYSNPHNPVPGVGAGRQAERMRAGLNAGLMGQGNMYSAPRAVKTVETQRQQVEDVFKDLKSGLDLEETDPPPTLVTKLYPHQKQALSFLLDRERLVEVPEQPGPNDDTTVSLWRRKTDPYNKPIGWRNLVTDLEILGATPPPQSRGSILADDMGLGKTLVVIALVATTLEEARVWATEPISRENFDNRLDTIGEKKVKMTDFSSPMYGLNREMVNKLNSDKAKGESKKKAAKIAREKKREDGMTNRFNRIVTRSPGTLIVCPLSTVQNWESQFEEHVAKPDGEGTSYTIKVKPDDSIEEVAVPGKRGRGKAKAKAEEEDTKPRGTFSVYVYHGNLRLSDPLKLAQYDVVITTFSTLGTEFSRQARAEEEREQEAAEAQDSDDALEVYDANGQLVEKPVPMNKNGKPKRKRKKIEGSGASPLQQVQWFRVVLDEAHIIKEHTTVQARAACELSASRRTALSGTPLQNSLNDLFSLVRFLRLEPFIDRLVWNQHIGNLAKSGDPLGVSRLQLIMRHLALRRTKASVDKNGKPILSLPPNNQNLVHLPFDPAEHAFYSSHHLRYKHDFKKLEETDSVMKNYCSILQELLRLRQICVHMALVRDSEDGGQDSGNLIETINKLGISKPRAIQLMGLMRDAGGATCSECGYDMIPAGVAAAVQEDDIEVDKKPAKKARKTTKSATASAACSDEDGGVATPLEYASVMTKCQHLFCQMCFKSKVYAKWPADVQADEKAICTVCQAEILPALDAVQIEARELVQALEEVADGDLQVTKGKGTRLFEHSTKTRALVEDIFPFSQANPASRNYWGGMDDPEAQIHKPIGFQPVKGEVVKSVVFSQWTKLLDRLGDALDHVDIKYGRLDGGMNRDARTRAMDAFKADPSTEVLLVSLRAGGVGLNLTAARRVYLMEPFWNPAVENQAVDRIHRLGQTQPVQTVRFVIEKSIEENMLKIQKRKTDLANMSLSQTLSKAELAKRRMEDLKTLLS